MSPVESYTVDFSSMDRYEVPFDDIDFVEKLLLDSNQLSNLLPTTSWASIAEHLRILSMSRNEIQSIPDDLCEILSARLQQLDVSENLLGELPVNFGVLNGLTRLLIAENQLGSLPDSFCQLHQLTELNLSNNQLANLPDAFGSLRSLTKLNLSCNRLESLPASFAELQAIEYLDLCQNRLTQLPSTFASADQSLKVLSLNWNLLSELPDWINRLRCVEHLFLFDNRLVGCPFSAEFALECQSSLTHLNLSSNSITSLPENIGELKRLEHFDVSNNQLSSLPASFGAHLQRCLRFCVLSGNQLVDLPDSFANLINLTSLQLAANRLQHVPECLANLHQSIEDLDLCQNQIIGLPDFLLEFHRLHRIDVGRNPFEDFKKMEQMLKKLKNQSESSCSINNCCVYSTSDTRHRSYFSSSSNGGIVGQQKRLDEEFWDDEDESEKLFENCSEETRPTGLANYSNQRQRFLPQPAGYSSENAYNFCDPNQLFIPSKHHIQVEPVWPAFKNRKNPSTLTSSNKNKPSIAANASCSRDDYWHRLEEQGVFDDAENDVTDY